MNNLTEFRQRLINIPPHSMASVAAWLPFARAAAIGWVPIGNDQIYNVIVTVQAFVIHFSFHNYKINCMYFLMIF